MDQLPLRAQTATAVLGILGLYPDSARNAIHAAINVDSPSYLESKSQKHIILDTESPARFIALLMEQTASLFRQPFCPEFGVLSPGLLIGKGINAGYKMLMRIDSDLGYIIKSISVSGGPIIFRKYWWFE